MEKDPKGMEFTLNTADLVRELGLLAGVTAKGSTIPILSHVLLAATDSRLILTATDLDFAIRCECAAKVKYAGSATLPAKKLFDYVKLLPGSEVSLKAMSNHWISVTSATAKARLAGMSPDVFPTLPEMPEEYLELPAKQLGLAIGRTEFAISKTDSRFTIDGALLVMQDGMSMVATDGHRISISRWTSRDTPPFSVLIPRQALGHLRRLMAASGDSETPLEFAERENYIFLQMGPRRLMSRLLAGKFPDYERILPGSQPRSALLDRATMAQVIDRVDQFSDEGSRMIRLRMSAGEARFSSSVSEVGESEESMPAEYSGPSVEIGFNAGYLLDLLKTVTENQVCFLFEDEKHAGELRPVSAGDASLHRYVVMPMRI